MTAKRLTSKAHAWNIVRLGLMHGRQQLHLGNADLSIRMLAEHYRSFQFLCEYAGVKTPQLLSAEVTTLYTTISDCFLIAPADRSHDWPAITAALTATSELIVPNVEWTYSTESCNPSASLAEALWRVMRPKPSASDAVRAVQLSAYGSRAALASPTLWLALRERLNAHESAMETDAEWRLLQESWNRCRLKWQTLDMLAEERQSLYSRTFSECAHQRPSFGWLRLDLPGFGRLACRHAERGVSALRDFSRAAEQVFIHHAPLMASSIPGICLVHSAPDDVVAIGSFESLSRFQKDIAYVMEERVAVSPRAACVPLDVGTTPASAATTAQEMLAEMRLREKPGA